MAVPQSFRVDQVPASAARRCAADSDRGAFTRAARIVASISPVLDGGLITHSAYGLLV
jgi:hypothetical protein